ncbi:MAG: hypothetical protein DMF72_09725 [Acidobacteria bacterium]|nr:MAG: hypothetical protein DMF72_09725 [Acidobacteriota bacterium]
MTKKDEILELLEDCSSEERREIFNHLRKEFPIHALEADLNTQAEVILEAMARSSDLTMRGIRGIIAEAAFLVDVLQKMEGWKTVQIVGDASYDFLIADNVGQISIQVKMQRREKGVPLVRAGKFVVETQRTRTGKDAAGGATRPYRFGEFDLLAVSLHPSTNDWTRFLYTVGAWMRPRASDANLLEVLQPIPPYPNDDWTDQLETCIEWLRSGARRTIESF